MTTKTAELPAGKRINNRYQIITVLGEGGMGRVYLVADEIEHGRQVALKTLRADLNESSYFEFFSHEFSALTKLTHPNLAEVYDFGRIEETGELFFTLEYVIGRNLYDATTDVEPSTILDYLVQICRALEYIHHRGLIHHDVKPANILVIADDELGGRIKLMDFGLSLEEEMARNVGEVRGTLSYLAPEIASGSPYDRRSDFYSLGIVLYRLLRRRMPIEELPTSQHLFFDMVPRPPDPDRVDMDPRFRTLLRRLVATDPAERFPSANQIVLEINRLFDTGYEIETKETTAGYILSGRFVGRRDERARLDQILGQLQLGAPSIPMILFSGQAGMGKSRLLREWKISCQLAGIPFVQSRCYETLLVPYGPVSDLLRQVISLVGPESPLVHRHRDDLTRLVPELSGELDVHTDVDSDIPADPRERLRLMDNLTAFLVEVAEKQPLVCAISDLHWADSETIELLRHVVRTLVLSYATPGAIGEPPAVISPWHERPRPGLFLCGTFRAEEAAGLVTSLVEELEEGRFYERWDLRELETDEVAALVSSMLGLEEPPQRFARRLAEETDGNPYFVEEVMKSLIEDQRISKLAGDWEVVINLEELEIPRSCEDVIDQRLARLSEAARRIVELLAVVESPAPLGLLRAVPLEGLMPRRGLRELERHHLLARDLAEHGHSYLLHQTSTRRVVYRSIDEDRRRDLHRAVAVAIEAYYAERPDHAVVALAHHHIRGGNRGQAIFFGMRAARRSASLYAHKQAISLYEEVLELLTPADRAARYDVLSSLGDLYKNTGNYEASRRCYEDAGPLVADASQRADLMRRLGEMTVRQGNYAEALAMYARVEEIIDEELPSDAALVSRLLIGQARVHELTGEYDAGIEKAQAALAIGPPEEVEVTAYQVLGNLHWCLGKYKDAIERHQRALAIEEKRESVHGLAACYNNLALVYQDLGENDRALELYEKSLANWEKYGDPAGVALCYSNLGILHKDRGDYQRSVRFHRGALTEYERLGVPIGIARASECLGEVYADLGQWTESEACHQRCLAICEDSGNVPLSIYAYINLGQNYATFGALRQALDHCETAISLASRIQARMLIGAGYLLKGDIHRRQFNWDEALSYLERAEALFEELGNRPEKVKAQSLLACLFHEMGEQDLALRRASEALAEAGDLGNRELAAGLRHLSGAIHHTRGELEQARAALDISMELALELGKEELLWRIHHDSGRLHYATGAYNQAREDLMRAVELGRRIWEALPVDLKELFLKDPRHIQLSKDVTVLRNRLKGRFD